ncbi:hypothetical protein FA95DRAFT_1565039 [Auriscalpium vulgare]|uniref:Uncharacterized protein n=1 Tax=Auriscalpium vulgare TaxID=40419 RepID=A0ACB8RDT4_9AGAM|nr:hypothetical protein FA95DRAFT_1565039 [Auriscalpium vulgare]
MTHPHSHQSTLTAPKCGLLPQRLGEPYSVEDAYRATGTGVGRCTAHTPNVPLVQAPRRLGGHQRALPRGSPEDTVANYGCAECSILASCRRPSAEELLPISHQRRANRPDRGQLGAAGPDGRRKQGRLAARVLGEPSHFPLHSGCRRRR